MRRIRTLLLAGVVLTGLTLAACSAAPTPQATVGPPPTARATRSPTRVPSFTPAPAQTRPILPTIAPAQTWTPRPATATLAIVVAPTGQVSQTLAPPTSGAASAASGATPAASISGPALTISSASANVRSGPGATYPVIGAANKGQQLAVTGKLQDGSWWQVTYLGKPAWIAASVVSASADAATVALVAELPATPAAQLPAPTNAAPAAAGGGRIVFARGNGADSDIALLNVATGQISVLAGHGRQPDMYPDGQIIFAGAGNGRENLWTMRADGSGAAPAGGHPEDRYPSWSPAKEIIFFSTVDKGVNKLYRHRDLSIPRDNTSMEVEQIHGGVVPLIGRYPVWVSDTRFAFAGCSTWTNGSDCGIWTLNVDAWAWQDFQAYQVTIDQNDRPSDTYGQDLLYSSAAGGNWEVNAIRFTPPSRRADPKGTPRNLTNNPAQDVGATYSPDGQSIAFISNRGGGWGIWVMNADGGSPRLLAAVPEGFGPHWDEERLSWAQ
jgi:WD40-like Beta Propeller Repeat/Bacterial SH3 domain